MGETLEKAPEVVQNTVEVVSTVTENVVEETKSLMHVNDLLKYLTAANLMHVATSLIVIFIFFIVFHIIKKIIGKGLADKIKPHTAVLLGKTFSYLFWILIGMYVLSLFGVNFTAIWGAAGVAGLAIGFAAQTSVSNIISGVFVLSEKALKIGDYITVGGVSGSVDSIDLLSIKIHTPDNQMVRIPNSSIINGNLINYNYFPIRRYTFDLTIAYDSDMQLVLDTLKKVPSLCTTILEDPAPLIYYDELQGSGIDLKFCVWFNCSDLFKAKTEVFMNIIKVCREANIEIPYTKIDVDLYTVEKKVVTVPVVPAQAEV